MQTIHVPTETFERVVIGTHPDLTGNERLVGAFRDGEDVFIPLDRTRSANQEFLHTDRIYVGSVDTDERLQRFEVRGHRPINPAERERLASRSRAAIAETTDLLHLTQVPATPSIPIQGYVAVVDGSERTMRVLGPAAALADWYGMPLTVCIVTSDGDDKETTDAVDMQLESLRSDNTVPCAPSTTVVIDHRNVEATLAELAGAGQVPVVAAFGTWKLDARLRELLTSLMNGGVPSAVAIGPNVPADWAPHPGLPIVIGVDHTDHAHDIVERLAEVQQLPRAPLHVLHAITPDSPDTDANGAAIVASELQRRTGAPVGSTSVTGTNALEAVMAANAELHANMFVTRSWHRAIEGRPRTARLSFSLAAQLGCPVVILSES